MFAGAGGEVLYWPHKSCVAFGASATYVKQRHDRDFELLDYSVVTGHVSLSVTPFYNYDVAVHAGRYLAKDLGATLRFAAPSATVGRWVFGPH